MDTKIDEIHNLIKDECLNLGLIDTWFYSVHLLAVEKFAKQLLEKLPEADEEIVLLGVWLHDLQRIRGLNGDHAKTGAEEAEKVMKQFNYPDEKIEKVKNIILSHSCDTELMPTTIEGKILASADAMSHYTNDFYLIIAATKERDLAGYKKWALEKIEKDYNKKISFDFAKESIKDRYEALKKVLTMD